MRRQIVLMGDAATDVFADEPGEWFNGANDFSSDHVAEVSKKVLDDPAAAAAIAKASNTDVATIRAAATKAVYGSGTGTKSPIPSGGGGATTSPAASAGASTAITAAVLGALAYAAYYVAKAKRFI